MRINLDMLLEMGETFLKIAKLPLPPLAYVGIKQLVELLKSSEQLKANTIADKLLVAIKEYEKVVFDELDAVKPKRAKAAEVDEPTLPMEDRTDG